MTSDKRKKERAWARLDAARDALNQADTNDVNELARLCSEVSDAEAELFIILGGGDVE